MANMRPDPLHLKSLLPPLTPVVRAVSVVLIVAFIANGLLVKFSDAGAALLALAPLDAAAVLRGELWRLLTYGVIHSLGSPFHVLFNVLAIVFFGPAVERRLGSKAFALLFAVAILVGGVFVVVGHALGISFGFAIGASAAVQATLVLWGFLHWDQPLLIGFVLPATGKHVLGLSLFLYLLEAVSQSGTSAAAHLGGIVTALLWHYQPWHRVKLRRSSKHLKVVPRQSPKEWIN